MLTENAIEVLKKRYIQKDEQGNELETIDNIWRRVAKDIASAEKTEELRKEWEEKFYHEISNLRFLPNSPNLMNSGTNNGLAYNACYTTPIKDTILSDKLKAVLIDGKTGPEIENLDSGGILDALLACGMITKTGGGVGFTLDQLRPCGDWISTSHSKSGGPIDFWYVIAALGAAMQQGGHRRGAYMMTMSLSHPDILKFITAKDEFDPWMSEKLGYPARRFGNFNISIKVRDSEMKIIQETPSTKFVVTNPRTKEQFWIPKSVNIKNYHIQDLYKVGFSGTSEVYTYQDIWDMVMERAWSHADPGILCWDRVDERFSLSEDVVIETTNPCQNGDATVLTPDGIKTFNDIKIGDIIYNGQGSWTKITNKISTGIKPVYLYKTNAGIFSGTKNHRVLQNGEKIEVSEAEKIDLCEPIKANSSKIIPEIVMDGLIIGDGTKHSASSDLILLIIGKDDQSYFESEIRKLLIAERPGIKTGFWEVKTSVAKEELPKTYLRSIPDRFRFGNIDTKCSFLRGLYSANGSIVKTRVTLKVASLDVIEQTQEMLSSLGIRSYYTTNKENDVEFSNGTYTCKQSYDLNISSDRNTFRELIGFIQPDKQDRLNNICENNKIVSKRTKTSYEIKEIEYIGEEEVFDITVDCPEHTYWTGGLLVSNCGEQPLESSIHGGGVCNLASIDLAKFVKDGKIDKESLKKSCQIMCRFLDNVVDRTPYPLDGIRKNAQKWRRIGAGPMGWGNTLAKLRIPYDSEEAIKLATEIGNDLKLWTEEASEQLAIEKGPFPGWEESKLKKIGYLPRRNSYTTNSAPTGTLSIIANTSGGIEPIFALAFERSVMRDHTGKIAKMKTEINEVFLEALDKFFGLPSWPKTKEWIINQCKENGGSIQKIQFSEIHKRIIDEFNGAGKSYEEQEKEWLNLQKVFVTSHDIHWHNHVTQQTAWTNSLCKGYSSSAISKTINCPKNITKEEIGKLYLEAWKEGCIGITMYRAGSHEGEPMTTKVTVEDVQKVDSGNISEELKNKTKIINQTKIEVPSVADSIYVNQKCHAGTIHVSLVHDRGVPLAVFAQLGKGGEDVHSFLEALGRSISIGLQSGVPIEYYIKQFDGIKTSKTTFVPGGKVLSIPDALAKALKQAMSYIYDDEDDSSEEYLEPDTSEAETKVSEISGDVCPDCGSLMIKTSGCKGGLCQSCGHSEC